MPKEEYRSTAINAEYRLIAINVMPKEGNF
jgi:hypothetical protein